VANTIEHPQAANQEREGISMSKKNCCFSGYLAFQPHLEIKDFCVWTRWTNGDHIMVPFSTKNFLNHQTNHLKDVGPLSNEGE
jgi:hypothetical protein